MQKYAGTCGLVHMHCNIDSFFAGYAGGIALGSIYASKQAR
jgi:hypothetical protein